jgi:uncharacterized protein (DUF1697 family)
MTTYIALLRGINIAGHNLVAMADLRAMLTRLGFTEPRTLLQSGNVVFQSRLSSAPGIEQTLEEEAKKRLSIETPFFVRTAEEWESIVERNPFKTAAKKDPGRLVVVCFKEAPAPNAVKELQRAIEGPETFRADGRHAYITYPDGQGKSLLTMNLIDSKLRTKGTARNWNTVLKLANLSSP